MDLPIALLIAALAAGTGLAVYLRTDATSQAHRRNILEGAAGIVDASIAMYMVRKALGHPTSTRAERAAERARLAFLAEAERRRAGASGPAAVAPTRLVVAGTAASHSPRDLPDRQAHPVDAGPVVPIWARRSTVPREGVVAIAGLVVVMIAAFAIWPRDAGGVLVGHGHAGGVQPGGCGVAFDPDLLREPDRRADGRRYRHGVPDDVADADARAHADADRHAQGRATLHTSSDSTSDGQADRDAEADRHPCTDADARADANPDP